MLIDGCYSKIKTMKYLMLIFSMLVSVLAFGQVLPSPNEVDSIDVDVKPKNGKGARLTYFKEINTPFGKDVSTRKSPELDSVQIDRLLSEAYLHVLGYNRRAADATASVWSQVQAGKGVDSYKALFKKLKRGQYEDHTWQEFGRAFVGDWLFYTSDKDYVSFTLESDGTVKLTSSQPKSKATTPRFDILADVRVVVDGVVSGKPVVFDFVAQGLFWNLQTGYLLQKVK